MMKLIGQIKYAETFRTKIETFQYVMIILVSPAKLQKQKKKICNII